MRYENFGPIANPDGTPSQVTIDMLRDTGRDPEEFVAAAARLDALPDGGSEADLDREVHRLTSRREKTGTLAGHFADGRGHVTTMECCGSWCWVCEEEGHQCKDFTPSYNGNPPASFPADPLGDLWLGVDTIGDDCPEYCGHLGGSCEESRRGIYIAERQAEEAASRWFAFPGDR